MRADRRAAGVHLRRHGAGPGAASHPGRPGAGDACEPAAGRDDPALARRAGAHRRGRRRGHHPGRGRARRAFTYEFVATTRAPSGTTRTRTPRPDPAPDCSVHWWSTRPPGPAQDVDRAGCCTTTRRVPRGRGQRHHRRPVRRRAAGQTVRLRIINAVAPGMDGTAEAPVLLGVPTGWSRWTGTTSRGRSRWARGALCWAWASASTWSSRCPRPAVRLVDSRIAGRVGAGGILRTAAARGETVSVGEGPSRPPSIRTPSRSSPAAYGVPRRTRPRAARRHRARGAGGGAGLPGRQRAARAHHQRRRLARGPAARGARRAARGPAHGQRHRRVPPDAPARPRHDRAGRRRSRGHGQSAAPGHGAARAAPADRRRVPRGQPGNLDAALPRAAARGDGDEHDDRLRRDHAPFTMGSRSGNMPE